MKVAHIGLRALDPALGGIEAGLEALAPRLAERGWESLIFVRSRYHRLPVHPSRGLTLIPLPSLPTQHLETLSYMILAALKVRGVDCVHLHALGPSTLAPLFRAQGLPVVCTVHGLDWQRPKWGAGARFALQLAERVAAHGPDRTIVVSRELETWFQQQYGVETVCIPNGVAPFRAPSVTPVLDRGLSPGRFVLFLGRLVPDKQVDLLINAFRRLEGPWQLAIAGPDATPLEHASALRRQAGGDARIRFLGPVGGGLRDALLAHAGAFALPSRLEGLSLALLEALAAEAPVVASDIAPNREVLTTPTGAVGTLVHPDDADALAAALRTCLEDPIGSRERAARGRRWVEARYGWERAADSLAEVYASVVRQTH